MLCCVLPMLAIILLTDRMSVMSCLYSVFMIVWCWTVLLPSIGLFCCTGFTIMFIIVLFAHRHNIVRVFTGKESRLGIRKALRGKGEHHLQELKEREERKNAEKENNGINGDGTEK